MAREDIQLNVVAPQANLVQPADTYVRPYWDRNAGSGYMELAKSLGILGDTIAAKQARAQQGQETANYEYYQSMAGEFGQKNNSNIIANKETGIFNLFSSGQSSKITRNRVEEVNGDRQAVDDFYNVYGQRLVKVANDPQALQAEIKAIKAEAWGNISKRGNTPDVMAYGDSYFKQLDQRINGFSAKAFEQQSKDYYEKEKISVSQGAAGAATPDPTPNVNLGDHVVGADNSLISYLSKGKPQSYISDLNPEFSTRISKMIAAAPPEIRAKIKIDSGARTPQRQYELIKAKLPRQDIANLDGFVSRMGVEKGTAAWAAAFPKAAQARGIGKMIALPGRSLHQHGNAIDFARDPEAEAWMHKNAGKFGLYYPMNYEPWHIELIGGRSSRRNYSGIQSSGGDQDLPVFGPYKPDMNVAYRGWDNSPNFFENFYKTMNGVENAAGDPYATNPNSTASGHSQFIDSTWVEQYHKVYGDDGKTTEEILALRADKNIDKAIAINYAKENAKALESLALPVNTTTILMAHQLGAFGAGKVLQAMKDDPSQPIEGVLSEAALKSNPQYSGMTVSQVWARAADATGEFTDPVNGVKERTTTAYLEGLHSSPLGPVEYTKAFAGGIIDRAEASNSTELLDAMPSEIMALPEYSAKVAAAREKIQTNKRQALVFQQSQLEKAQKEKTEEVLANMAVAISRDPTAEIPQDVKEAIMLLPGGGFEVMKKLDEFRTAALKPTPEQQRQDKFTKAQAAGLMVDYANGDATFDQVQAKINEIKDPAMYGSALEELAKYRHVPDSIDNPLVKESKRLFVSSNYKYVEGTPIADPMAAKKAADAIKLYNVTLASLLASEPPGKVSERRLLEIINEVEAHVSSKVVPTEVGGTGDTTKNAANQGDTPAAPAAPVVPLSPVEQKMTPKQLELYNRLKPSNRFIGVGPR